MVPQIVLLLCAALVHGLPTEGDFVEPTLEIVMTIHPYNKRSFLPFSLGGIESQIYPKERINVVFRVGVYGSESLASNVYKKNQVTLEILRLWKKQNEDLYHKISIVEDLQNVELESKEEYWSRERFSQLIQIKEHSFRNAIRDWAEFVLFIDADVIFTNPSTFQELLIRQRNDSHVIFSPVLDSLGAYSNFWAGISDRGYYLRTEDYLPILERKKTGVFAVPMVHSCVFIDLVQRASHSLSFSPKKNSQNPFDDIISFAASAKSLSLQMFVNNVQVWGYIPPNVDKSQQQTKDLLDLELESLVDKNDGFTVAVGLEKFVHRPEPDTLGVDNIYVINLIRRKERYTQMKKSLEILGLTAQFWPATDGHDLSLEGIDRLGVKVLPGYSDPYQQRPMTLGEIGCFLSHYFVWKDMIARNISTAIVLEDDVRFEKRFREKVSEGLKVLLDNDKGIHLSPSTFDFVYLGRKRQSSLEEERVSSFFVKPRYSYWTIGYMLTRAGAIKLIDVDPLRKLLPVDEFLPIMYDEHPNQEWTLHFSPRNLRALSFDPVVISPTHYIGDEEYISDTEDSERIDVKHPKQTHSCPDLDATCHTEL